MMTLWRQRSERLVKRRQDDVKDQAMDYMAGMECYNICYMCILLMSRS